MRRNFRRSQPNNMLKLVLVLFMIAAFLGGATTLMIESFLRPSFMAMAEARAIQLVNTAINKAVYEHAKNLKYTDLIHYQTNNQGDIILMQPNLQVVNEFVSTVNLSINKNLEGLRDEVIRIPIGQALGFQVLAGFGPRMSVRMLPMGIVKPSTIVDSFETAGINQTRHKIYMNVSAEVRVLVPFVARTIQMETQIPVTEVTIIGKVPEVYVGIDGGVLQQIIDRNR